MRPKGKTQMVAAVSEMQKQELLTSYSALILHDGGAAITEDNISKLIAAAGGKVEPYWPKLFADLLEGKDVAELLMNPGAGAAPAAGGAAAPGAAAAAEAPAAVVESESEEEVGGGGLFGSDEDSDSD